MIDTPIKEIYVTYVILLMHKKIVNLHASLNNIVMVAYIKEFLTLYMCFPYAHIIHERNQALNSR